jgi:hypothetical protein
MISSDLDDNILYTLVWHDMMYILVFIYHTLMSIYSFNMILDGENSETVVVENDGDVTDAEEGRERGDRPITILRNTLKWGHLCPTAPGMEIYKNHKNRLFHFIIIDF